MKISNASPNDLELGENGGKLSFNGIPRTPDVRTLGQMAHVLSDRQFAARANPGQELYYMYREAVREQDKKLFEKNATRYDVTVIPPLVLGGEFNKTAGHYHPPASPSKHASFPELYQVLSGESHYLLQKRVFTNRKEIDEELEDAVLVHAKAGDAVLVPPNYGHVTINPSATQILVMANLVESHFKSDYEPYKKLHGAAFFELADDTIVPNKNYTRLPQLRKVDAAAFAPTKSAGITNESIYQQFLDAPEKFSFLTNP